MIRRLSACCLLVAALVLALARTAGAADLTVVVTGLGSDDGDVHIAVYDTPETFPKGGVMLREGLPKPQDRRAIWRFENLPPGRYAVATFHDANGNHSFDQGLFGIPLEPYGFSSGATALFSAPAFEEAAFDLPADGLTITIDLGK